ncbi:MAG: hypothetical protein WBA44_15105 [Mesorhizobium sp.]
MTDWRARLAQGQPVVKPAPRTVGDMVEGQIMLVPTARQVDEAIRRIPAGRSLNVRELRLAMAASQGAEVSCPVYTGYHLRTVAEVAAEDLRSGAAPSEVTPFWRVLDANTPTTKKIGAAGRIVADQRSREGLGP